VTQHTTAFVRSLGVLLALVLLSVGCAVPVYTHTVTTKYDADGKVIGAEEVEAISQPTPFASPFKVRITQRDKLEK
jgi:hypothetical protein